MKRYLFAAVFLSIILMSCGKNDLDGEYHALQPENYSTEDGQWFHENTIQIKNSNLTLGKIPVFFKNGKRFQSETDGGYFIYTGKIIRERDKIYVNLELKDADYVIIIDKKKSKQPVKKEITLTKTGILLDGLEYKRIK